MRDGKHCSSHLGENIICHSCISRDERKFYTQHIYSTRFIGKWIMTKLFSKYYTQKEYIKLTKPLRPKMPSSLWGHGIITVKSKWYFYSKAIILIQWTFACIKLMIIMLPNEDRRAENLVHFQSVRQTALCWLRLNDSIKYFKNKLS